MHQHEPLAVLNVKTNYDTPRCVFIFFINIVKHLSQHVDYESILVEILGAQLVHIVFDQTQTRVVEYNVNKPTRWS